MCLGQDTIDELYQDDQRFVAYLLSPTDVLYLSFKLGFFTLSANSLYTLSGMFPWAYYLVDRYHPIILDWELLY